MKPLMMRDVVGGLLREQRLQQGRTLKDVSGLACISLGYLSEVERGEKEPSSELLSSICAALEIPLAHLLMLASSRMADHERLALRRAA